uniref:Uncharacterized protein n=1 Tax=Anguilla anguilla TaxID=7936 RepID=A0A0E9W708_ANGAN
MVQFETTFSIELRMLSRYWLFPQISTCCTAFNCLNLLASYLTFLLSAKGICVS